ncbi:MAG: Raf kinase inhibitor-like YbhB/YbcL family protein [Rickettsiales bacterium]
MFSYFIEIYKLSQLTPNKLFVVAIISLINSNLRILPKYWFYLPQFLIIKMKKIILSLFFLCCFSSFANAGMTISSPDFKQGETIPKNNVFNGFGCTGSNIFPRIEIKDIPLDAKSLAVTIYDPDAPTGSGWWHFIAYNIPTRTSSAILGNNNINHIKIDNIKDFVDGTSFGRNDYGTFDYGGPCPPKNHGVHRYVLTAYALGTERISLPGNSPAAMIGYNINANMIEKAAITSFYKR